MTLIRYIHVRSHPLQAFLLPFYQVQSRVSELAQPSDGGLAPFGMLLPSMAAVKLEVARWMSAVRARSVPSLSHDQPHDLRGKNNAASQEQWTMRSRPSQTASDGEARDGCAVALPVSRLMRTLGRILEEKRSSSGDMMAAGAGRSIGRAAADNNNAEAWGDEADMSGGPPDPAHPLSVASTGSQAEVIMRVMQAAASEHTVRKLPDFDHPLPLCSHLN